MNQFSSVFLFLIALIWFFSAVAFFFLRPNFIKADLEENVCESYFRCFLTYFNYGIRDGGPFDMPASLAYSNSFYYKFFAYDWFFFFSVQLIMLNVVNAIIVDSFQSFREEKTTQEKKMNDNCYICNLPRIEFEMHGFNFQKHIEQEHNIKSYLKLLIKITEENEFNLNLVQSFIKNSLAVGQVEFFPDQQAMCLIKK